MYEIIFINDFESHKCRYERGKEFVKIKQLFAVDSVLTVRNLAGNVSALNITPVAGGTRPVSAY